MKLWRSWPLTIILSQYQSSGLFFGRPMIIQIIESLEAELKNLNVRICLKMLISLYLVKKLTTLWGCLDLGVQSFMNLTADL